MPPLVAICPFQAPNLCLTRDALGASFYLERRGYPILIALPAPRAALADVPEDSADALFGREADGAPDYSHWDLEFRAVHWLTLVVGVDDAVDIDRPLSVLDFLDVARDVATEFAEYCRVWCDFHWLPAPPPLAGTARLVDIGEGTVQDEIREPIPVTLAHYHGAIDHAAAQQIAVNIEKRFVPTLADLQLAEARHLVWPSRVADTPRAVLAAAIAAEVKVQRTLRGLVRPDAEDMLELLLGRYSRDMPRLYSQVAKVVCGRSLADENPVLHKRVGELFTARASVAHPSEHPQFTLAEARAHLETAREAMRWLDSLGRLESQGNATRPIQNWDVRPV